MTDRKLFTLAQLSDGERAVVDNISGESETRRRLAAMGIFPGREIKKISGGENGPFVISAAGASVALGENLGLRLSLRPVQYKLLLTGNPNVGKSVVFSRLTGLETVSSNYPGTTVEVSSGTTRLGGLHFSVTDVPGTYSFAPTCKAEDVACRILGERDCDLIVHVVDATNLERNLFFTLQIIETGLPVIILLNKTDTAKLRGVTIDADLLSSRLGVPVIPFVAVTGEGVRSFEKAAAELAASGFPRVEQPQTTDEQKWTRIGRLSRDVQTIKHKHPSIMEQLAELSVRPVAGLLMAFAVLAISFIVIRFSAEGLIDYVLGPIYEKLWLPLALKAANAMPWPILRDVLAGTPTNLGLLTNGIEIAAVDVLSYVAVFYAVFGFLEDLGYLPRLAVLLDRTLHKIGLHGYGCIPALLGLGCKVPGILATRVLETRRERVIALSLLLLVAPCMPQSAMIISLAGKAGFGYVMAIFITLVICGTAAGFFLHKIMKGETPELFVEVPAWSMPSARPLFMKLHMRVRNYLTEAIPMILLGVLLVAAAEATGVAQALATAFSGPVSFWLGLPSDTVPVILTGFLRKDVSVALLVPFHLAPAQIVTACVFLSMYLPCLASLLVMAREAGWKDAALVAAINFVLALFVGGVLHFLGFVFL